MAEASLLSHATCHVFGRRNEHIEINSQVDENVYTARLLTDQSLFHAAVCTSVKRRPAHA
ncbi:hypothetical protein AG1IA_01200 [Rhizoctonia solani AG-1 IA]|uniref:Uncharacterized protein n=1 Tax=Thanatephorus cucumeris (strain AG1-IA) TaxID=983506 RepID=L8X3D0_THACA|nr:hypothetical protein AG1IA_01200 [Rhizoctonia solani AG-1 IA]